MRLLKNSKTEYLFKGAFEEVLKVMEFGAQKYGADSWLTPQGSTSSKKDMFKSMCSHAAEYFAGHTKDAETGLHPSLHGACRNIMAFIVWDLYNNATQQLFPTEEELEIIKNYEKKFEG